MTDPLFAKPRKWRQARWIWAPEPERLTNHTVYFRHTFHYDGSAEGCRLYIAADTRYRLWVNGAYAGQGAPQSQPFLQYYDERDIAQLLQPGPNCIAIEVYHSGRLPDTRGGLLAELIDGAGNILAATGKHWPCITSPAYRRDTMFVRMNKTVPFQEMFDARREPQGWRHVDFDDDDWQTPQIVKGRISERPPAAMPWSRLVPRDIPYMHQELRYAQAIAAIQEHQDLDNRTRPEDLSIALSLPGRPLQYSRVENPEALLAEDGETLVQSSTRHLDDLAFDGIHDPAILLDFGKVLTAYADIAIEGPAGARVEIGYAERLIDGHFVNSLEGQFADCLTLRQGENRYRPFHWKAFRYLKIRFRNCTQPARIRHARAIVTTYPYEERGRFASGDDTLNAVFQISRETLRLCSNEFLMDTPWREQAQWLGDVAAVTVPAIYACFGDTDLAGKFYRQAAENQHPPGLISNVSNIVNHAWLGAICDYSLWWVMGLWQHYMYTGDERWVHEFYPQASRVMGLHRNYFNDRGLIEDMPYWVFIDWADTDRRGECAAYNAIFVGALEAYIKMADLKGDATSRQWAQDALQAIRNAFQDAFYDPKRQAFADARIDGELSTQTSEHANAAAIHWGLCDDDTARGIVAGIWENGMVRATEAQPFFMVVVLNALDRIGRFDLALDLLRQRWGGRMVAKGCTSVLEEWYENGSYRHGEFCGFMRTHSHAWSACPAEFLIRNLMGLEILEPGCARIRLKPRDARTGYEAVYPTPRGAIRVTWGDEGPRVETPPGIAVAP